MEWEITYLTESVQQTIENWPMGVRAVYTRITDRMKTHGPNLGMPFTRSMGSGLFEVRARGAEGYGRAFFCTVIDRRIIVLHAIIKKTDKTPLQDLETARARLKEVRHENP
ncbi:MAG: type II toxin-antitoxin system RelE/ParE family toxin [Magnetococcales bacterium]|nr:type II toxin-antitoxin system RelE/ParE family toxin [Magnetococcales bacterium]NGZ27161.1 type II toxin-antitoxin system RelE/ParE family toxin [Magnetococcales bacterium]